MLKAGDKAPAFTLKDRDGKDVCLSDFAGKKSCCIFILKTIRPAVPNRPALSPGFMENFRKRAWK